jgi:hypothetical protein
MRMSSKIAFAIALSVSLFSLESILANDRSPTTNTDEMPATGPTAGANSIASIPHRRRGEFGNKHKNGCPGILGWCKYGSISKAECVGDCGGEFSIRLMDNKSALITIETMPGKFDPKRDMAENTFIVAEDYPIDNPEELGYRTLSIRKGNYRFDWKTRSFTARIKGIRESRVETRPIRERK